MPAIRGSRDDKDETRQLELDDIDDPMTFTPAFEQITVQQLFNCSDDTRTKLTERIGMKSLDDEFEFYELVDSWMQKVKRTIRLSMSSSVINISTNRNTASICHVMGKSQSHEQNILLMLTQSVILVRNAKCFFPGGWRANGRPLALQAFKLQTLVGL